MWKKLTKLRNEYLSLELNETIDYERFAMISIVYNSTKIEGCSLTEEDTKILLEKDITAMGKPLSDHLMVKDHFIAFEFIKKEAEKKRKLSIDFIKKIASLVMKNTGGEVNTIAGSFDVSKGDLRLAQVYVEKKYFPDFHKIESLLNQLVESVNQKLDGVKENDVLKLAADTHYNLVNIHPFGDGNGRTSRLLMNYIQLYHKEPLVKIFTEDRLEYINALNKTEEENNLQFFRDFVCQQQIKFYENEISKFSKKDGGFTLMF